MNIKFININNSDFKGSDFKGGDRYICGVTEKGKYTVEESMTNVIDIWQTKDGYCYSVEELLEFQDEKKRAEFWQFIIGALNPMRVIDEFSVMSKRLINNYNCNIVKSLTISDKYRFLNSYLKELHSNVNLFDVNFPPLYSSLEDIAYESFISNQHKMYDTVTEMFQDLTTHVLCMKPLASKVTVKKARTMNNQSKR